MGFWLEGVLILNLQTDMIDGVLQCTLYNVTVSYYSYNSIYSVSNKFSINKPGRNFSRTGPNVLFRVWFMFGFLIWAETTSNKA